MSDEDWEWAERGFSPNDKIDGKFEPRESDPLKLEGSWITCDSYVPRDATSLEAKIMGEVWCNSPVEFVDAWGCDWLSEEFIREFLNICKEHGHTLKALQIKWGAHNCPGGEFDWCTNDMIDRCVIEWVFEEISAWSLLSSPKDHIVMVAAYRKMFQSFVETIKDNTRLE